MASPTDRLELPELPRGITWSVTVRRWDGTVLAARDGSTVCRTASIGKLFLLIEVARRIDAGELDPDAMCQAPADHVVADSGLLFYMRHQRLAVYDAAVLVASVSDNLATNALLHTCGLAAVRAVAPALGYRNTSLIDFIRDHRGPQDPWTPSAGTGEELSDLMVRLAAGSVISPAVSRQVLDWLALGVDTSMVLRPLDLDPLAHVDPDDEGLLVRHKTGTTSFARADVGLISGPVRQVAYAVLANWPEDGPSLHHEALAAMAGVGHNLLHYVRGGQG